MKSFIEYNYGNKLDILSDYFYENGFITRMYIKDNSIYLMDLKRNKSKLSGTYVMNKIIEFADTNNLNIKLIAVPTHTDINKLLNFYKKFGFKVIGDYSNIGKEMIRNPLK